MSFLKGVSSALVSGSSTHMLSREDFSVHPVEALPTTSNQGGRTQRVKTQARPAACPGAAGGGHSPVPIFFTSTPTGRCVQPPCCVTGFPVPPTEPSSGGETSRPTAVIQDGHCLGGSSGWTQGRLGGQLASTGKETEAGDVQCLGQPSGSGRAGMRAGGFRELS